MLPVNDYFLRRGHLMKRKKAVFILVCLLTLILQACNQTTNNESETTQSNNQKDVENIQTDEQVTDNDEENTQSDEQVTNNDEETNETVGIQTETLVSEALPLPTNFEEIISYPVGPFSGNGKNANLDGKNQLTDDELVDVILETLPAFTKEQIQEPGFLDQWMSALYYLIAEDYKDPQFIFDQMALESFGKPMINGNLIDFKEHLNVLIILDASGSMANTLNGETMMDIAKRELTLFIDQLPDNVNIGLRIYGEENASNGGKCSATKLYHPIAADNKNAIKTTIDGIKPGGWTPIAESLKQSAEDFSNYLSDTNTNFIYLISDGVETCDGNPENEVEKLRNSTIEPIVNVIGFNVDMTGQKQLKQIAELGQGQYIHVSNKEAFSDSMKSIQKIINAWEKQKLNAIDDAITARGKLDTAIYELSREWERQLTDEYNVMMLMMDAFNFSEGYFEDKQVFHDVHNQLLDKISNKNDLYREEFEKKSTELKGNVDQIFENILSEMN